VLVLSFYLGIGIGILFFFFSAFGGNPPPFFLKKIDFYLIFVRRSAVPHHAASGRTGQFFVLKFLLKIFHFFLFGCEILPKMAFWSENLPLFLGQKGCF